MTLTRPAPVSATERGHRALRRLVGLDPAEFGAAHWGRAPLLSRAADLPSGFGDLFSHDAVDELVSRRGLRTPFLRVARDGTTLAERAYTRGGGIGAGISDQVTDDALLRLFAEGATLVLQGLHRTWPALVDFCQELAADLGHPVQANAYTTPPQSTGFSDHYDVHDVFVLQVHGEKRWRVRAPVHPAPLRDQPWTSRRGDVERAAAAPPLLEPTLRPGDCLYLPRGYLHAATALGRTSTHLTLGVHPWTRHHLAEELVAAALAEAGDDVELRAALPLGVDLTDPASLREELDAVRSALVRALAGTAPDDLGPGLRHRVRDAQRAEPVAPLAQAEAARDLQPGQVLRLRRHLAAHLCREADRTGTLQTRAGTLSVAEDDLPALLELLDGGSSTVARLGQPLARRLLLAGVAVPAEDG